MKISIVATTLLSFTAGITAFTPSSSTPATTSSTQLQESISRRALFAQGTATAATAAVSLVLGGRPAPALAEVAAGTSLPQGALQFSRLIRLKDDLKAVITRVTEHPDELDKKEWDNLSDFLRILYKGSEDMKSIAKSTIYDPEKKKKAEEDVKYIQKVSQLGDGPVSKQDAEGLAKILTKSYLVIDDFFELLRDVPDEI